MLIMVQIILGSMKSFFKFYSTMLQKHPILTKCVTNGVIMSIGDAITQIVIQQKQFSIKRNFDLFIINFSLGGPAFHLWYCKILPKLRLVLFAKSSKPANVFGSMLLDQLLFAPLLYMSFFPLYQIVQDRDVMSLGKGVQVCKEKIWETVFNSWKLWPACSIINFWFVPVKYQSLFVSFTSFFWSMILSYIASK